MKKRYPHYPERPRRPEASAELWRSRAERAREFAELGRDGMRAIRRRIALVRALKDEAAGRPLTDDELDRVIPAVECRATRARLARTPDDDDAREGRS